MLMLDASLAGASALNGKPMENGASAAEAEDGDAARGAKLAKGTPAPSLAEVRSLPSKPLNYLVDGGE